jgi:diguanylate cyclase (GGDEF)-like protein
MADEILYPSRMMSVRPDDRLPAPPSPWSDTLTGADGPRFWDRILIHEEARGRRYARPITAVLVEVTGLDDLSAAWGADTMQQTFVRVARALATEVRTSDHIARIDRTRFGILLTETDEIAAINFIERARASCERQFQGNADVVSIAFGWASPTKTIGLRQAIETAEARLEAERDDARPGTTSD